jgi:hypothetical protein
VTLDLPDLPTVLAELVSRLQGMGLAAQTDVRDEAQFGSRLIEFADNAGPTRRAVRIVQDKGLWSVEIELGGRWRSPYQVLLALDDRPYSRRAVNHQERLLFTTEALQRLQTTTELPAILARLEEFDRAYLRSLGAKKAP